MNRAAFRNFARDRRGNVAMMFSLLAVPLIFVIGMAIDYGTAARLKSKLNAAADSAVLAAVTPAMMGQSDTAASTAAAAMFNAEVVGLPRLKYDPTTLSVTVTPAGLGRNVKVAYTAQSQNLFGGILNMSTIALGGSSAASAAVPPNMDFYLLLDSSPSMALPATVAGIQQMVAATPQQTSDGGQGCAFACHMSSTAASADNAGNPKVNGVPMDNYALAKSLNPPITLRIDMVRQAAQDLTVTATNSMNNPANIVVPVYRMAVNTFDTSMHAIAPLTSNLSSVSSQAANIALLEVYSNNNLTNGNNNNDEDTNFDSALQSINTQMPDPGNGASGQTPKEILFLVTDGVEDESVGGGRQESVINYNNWCQTIKNRNIQIAVLYTTYFPLNQQPTYSSWYMGHVAPFAGNIATSLQSCATDGLFYQVSVGEDISAALSNLFAQAVASESHLTQ
jgi:Flp pilus assembly protein TadG